MRERKKPVRLSRKRWRARDRSCKIQLQPAHNTIFDFNMRFMCAARYFLPYFDREIFFFCFNQKKWLSLVLQPEFFTTYTTNNEFKNTIFRTELLLCVTRFKLDFGIIWYGVCEVISNSLYGFGVDEIPVRSESVIWRALWAPPRIKADMSFFLLLLVGKKNNNHMKEITNIKIKYMLPRLQVRCLVMFGTSLNIRIALR